MSVYIFSFKSLTATNLIEDQRDKDLVACACGCGTIIRHTNKWGDKRKYISGHNRRGQHNPNSMFANWRIAWSDDFERDFEYKFNHEKMKEIFNIGSL